MLKTFLTALIAVFLVAAGPVSAEETVDDSASVTSQGGKKIIGALYDGQIVPADQTELSKSDIAGMKSGAGWGKLFQQLKLQGRYPEYRNLGDLISSRNRIERASHARNNNLQRTSRGATRPDRPTRPQKADRPTRPDRPSRPSRR